MDILFKDSQIHELNGEELRAIIAHPPILVDNITCLPTRIC